MLPLPWWAVILIFIFCSPSIVFAEPRFVASKDGIVITLHDDPCALSEVTNLPYRATWQEGGKTFQGCWGPRPDVQAAVAYFDDKTVAVIPFGVLARAQGA